MLVSPNLSFPNSNPGAHRLTPPLPPIIYGALTYKNTCLVGLLKRLGESEDKSTL